MRLLVDRPTWNGPRPGSLSPRVRLYQSRCRRRTTAGEFFERFCLGTWRSSTASTGFLIEVTFKEFVRQGALSVIDESVEQRVAYRTVLGSTDR
jgi:hypothetical protein